MQPKEWMAKAEQNMREQEAADLDAGRIRLADLDSDDDDYGGGKRGRKKKGGRRKGKKNHRQCSNVEDVTVDNDDDGVIQEVMDSSMDPSKDASINGEMDMNGMVAVESDAAISNETTNEDSHENNNPQPIPPDDESSSIEEEEEESEEEEEPDSWRCECCRKDFKSEKQFDNHIKSKKHKDMLKKYEKKLQREAVDDLLDELG
jgi:DnaJ family protein A protein 5